MSKWTTTAGPRQTKAIEKKLGDLRMEGTTSKTLTGIMGVTEGYMAESSHTSMELFGTARPEATAAMAAVGEKYGYAITRENHKQIGEDLETALVELKKSRPVNDERRTPEAEDERIDASKQREAERTAEAEVKAADNAVKEAEWLREFPYLETSGQSKKSRWALASGNIRTELGGGLPTQCPPVRPGNGSPGADEADPQRYGRDRIT